jgi:hypothetical protein
MKKATGAVASRLTGHLTLAAYLGAVLSPVLATPVSAQSNEDIRHMTVLQRPREAFDPSGIAIGGGLTFLPSVSVGETYDDNIYARGSGQVSDFETVIAPHLGLASNWSRHQFTFETYGKIHRYADRTTENNEEYGADGAVRLDVAHGGTLNLTGNYDRMTLARTDPENAGRLAPEQVDLTRGAAKYRQEFSRLLLGAGVNFQNWNETSSLDAEKNRNEYSGSVRAGYIFSPALNVFVEPSYTIRNFDRSTGVHVDHDSKILNIGAGVAYDITGILYGETTVGWYSVDFADPAVKNASGISVSSDTTWNVTARTSVLLNLQRQSDVSTQVFGASSNQRTSVELQLQHELTRNIVLQANASYANEDYVGSIPKRKDDITNGGIRADYYLDRHFAFYAAYQYYHRESTLANNTYDDNQITVGIHVQL